MCGIAGLFIKTKGLEPQLGTLLAKMTPALSSRGPDFAGFAIYGVAEFRRFGSARKLYNFNIDNAGAY